MYRGPTGPGVALTSRRQRERGKRGELFDADESLEAVQIGAVGRWPEMAWGGRFKTPLRRLVED